MAIIGVPGLSLFIEIDGSAPVAFEQFLSNSVQTITVNDISGGVPIVESLTAAKALWSQTILLVKETRRLYHPYEDAKSLTFKYELVKDFGDNTILFKYEIADDVSYEALFDKASQTITTEPRDTYTVNWVDFIGYFDAYSVFMREINTF